MAIVYLLASWPFELFICTTSSTMILWGPPQSESPAIKATPGYSLESPNLFRYSDPATYRLLTRL
jgi:hypothetical protein